MQAIPYVCQTAKICGLLLALTATATELLGQNVTGYDQMAEPLLFLLREPAVQRELSLTPDQQRDLVVFNEQWDGRLLMSRNWEPEKSQELFTQVLSASQEKLQQLLQETQRERLSQIKYRVRGIGCLLFPNVAERLELTDEQRGGIARILADTAQALEKLRTELAESRTTYDQATQESRRLRTAEQREIMGQLQDRQRRALKDLLGASFDLSQLGHVQFKAPPLAGSAEWINSQPLSIQGLRGQVVAVHFWAFGCHNCIQNYPWYKNWQREYAPRGLTIVGVHTPETSRERQLSELRSVVQEEGFTFPVLADMESQTWNLWGNSMWPSVYLIDKQGRIRYWWYGELDWQGAGGQEIMAKRIEELLAERMEG